MTAAEFTTALGRLRAFLASEQQKQAQSTSRMLELIEELHRSEQQRWVLQARVAGQEEELRVVKAALAVAEAKAKREAI